MQYYRFFKLEHFSGEVEPPALLEIGLQNLPFVKCGAKEIGEIANGGSVEVISNDIEPDIKCWIHYDGKALALGTVKLNKFYPSRVFNIENSI